MPKLKQIEEENEKIKGDNAYKDQEIISKIKKINELRGANEELEDQLDKLKMEVKDR